MPPLPLASIAVLHAIADGRRFGFEIIAKKPSSG